MGYKHLPTVQSIAIKHDFGDGRYMTLMVSKYPTLTVASLFGTEHGQIDYKVDDLAGGRALLESELARLFPHHTCSGQCHGVWRPFPNIKEKQGLANDEGEKEVIN